jgi:hypothetical protein
MLIFDREFFKNDHLLGGNRSGKGNYIRAAHQKAKFYSILNPSSDEYSKKYPGESFEHKDSEDTGIIYDIKDSTKLDGVQQVFYGFTEQYGAPKTIYDDENFVTEKYLECIDKAVTKIGEDVPKTGLFNKDVDVDGEGKWEICGCNNVVKTAYPHNDNFL